MTDTEGAAKVADQDADHAAPDELGDVAPAGEGLSDEQFAERVAGQTSSDLQAEDVFEREADGASTDEPVADVEGNDLT